MTAHAAVVARGMNKSYICGAREVAIQNGALLIGQTKIAMGSYLTINVISGEVMKGKVATVRQKKPFLKFVTFMQLVD